MLSAGSCSVRRLVLRRITTCRRRTRVFFLRFYTRARINCRRITGPGEVHTSSPASGPFPRRRRKEVIWRLRREEVSVAQQSRGRSVEGSSYTNTGNTTLSRGYVTNGSCSGGCHEWTRGIMLRMDQGNHVTNGRMDQGSVGSVLGGQLHSNH